MKKLLKIIAWILGGLLTLVALALATIAFKPLPNYPVEAPELKVELTPSRIQHGKELVSVGCAICHSDKNGQLGGQVFAENTDLGTIYAPNLTQDPNAVLAEYTDGELYYLLRTGIKRDGHLTLPMMLQMPNVADEELYSIIAFLRSDEDEVQPVAQNFPPYEPTLLAKALFTFAFKPLPFHDGVSLPDTLDPMTYGKYLVDNRYFCFQCHSASHEGKNVLEPEKSIGYLRGGITEVDRITGEEVVVPPIVIEPGRVVHNWTKAEFTQALKTGQRPDGRSNREPMQAYSFLDSLEVNAIYTYLQNAPPEVSNNELSSSSKTK